MRNKMMYDELALERRIKEQFGVDGDTHHIIVYRVPVSPIADATLFLTSKKQLFLYISGQSKLLFGDIKKIISRMGLRAGTYFPPKGRPDYFNQVGRTKFYDVFPGRKNISDEELIYYRTLAPYNPALALIDEIKDGHVYQYDSDSTTGWRVATKFAYRRIKTS
jgi:hypothetical protein